MRTFLFNDENFVCKHDSVSTKQYETITEFKGA